MKILWGGLIFLICSPAYSVKQSEFSSVTEKCSYSQQGIHTVEESSYSKLLATLRGDRKDPKYKKKRIKEGDARGQR